MQKVSVLIFSRNDLGNLLDLIESVYTTADEIVLIDSSDWKTRQRLLREKEKGGLNKVRIFYVVPMGYPDPLRAYGLSKCRNRWVLLVDTDERISEKLREELKMIIGIDSANAFAIKRYENFVGDGKPSIFTWQIRLFRKDRVEFKGLLHEQPIVRGALEKLEDRECFMTHVRLEPPYDRRNRSAGDRPYNEMEKFNRFSYKTYRKRVLGYLYRVSSSDSRKAKERALGKAADFLLKTYQGLARKEDSQEISNLDYRIFYLLTDVGYLFKRRDIRRMLDIITMENDRWDRVKKWKAEKDSREVFSISNIINEMGIIKFLRLDKEGVIKSINRRYRKGPRGIALLLRLLKERYEEVAVDNSGMQP